MNVFGGALRGRIGVVGAAAVCGLSLAFPLTAAAQLEQPLPPDLVKELPRLDPGAAEREQRRRAERLEQRNAARGESVLEEVQVTGDPAALDGPTFELRSVRFSRSELLTREVLREIVAPYLGKQVSHSDLLKIVEGVNRHYREMQVYTAVAVLPQQEIKDGVVVVRLIEGKLGEIRFEGNEYTSDEYLGRWMANHQGLETVDLPALEADILEFNRINDERLKAELRRGESFGLTDIVVTVAEPERGYFQAFADNYGFESSGAEELGFMYRRQHLLSDGDRSIAYLAASEGTQSLSMSYNTPISASRWRVGGSGSMTRTDLTAGDFVISDVQGDSYRLGLESSWLAWSGERLWASLIGGASYTRSATEVAGVTISDDAIQQIQVGASLNWIGSQWQVSGRQMALVTDFDDKSDEGSAQQRASEVLYNGGLSGYYRYRDSGFYGLAQAEWQYADGENLPGSLSFALGGPTSVRGYGSSEISGDRGWYGQLELHYDRWHWLNTAFDLFAFYDYGDVKSLNPQETLAAAGLGLNLSGRRWALNMSLAEALKVALPEQDDRAFYARFSYRY
ncbi:ShlB/FhaC/HecB family hemolysin secretion/activation protein [Microbulbifer hainanensis]|uniref:ShlB/FhaC/HecB family hemolysin secretion/activation protein n=1 Tax=Microbulbifer hainanensis TaxID=2735675 RepID=UPI001868A25B|nr:ShlB/FhaC/HecB family hemolysin secretion/activation protein [Microbulbifer hainanensis]